MRESGSNCKIQRITGALSPADPVDAASALPLVVSLNCLEDTSFELEFLAGVASVEYVGLSHLADGRIESAVAVLLHSLTFLPRAAQRRLQPWQLILCLGSTDRAVDSSLAADLGLRLVHVDVNRSEEIADTVMALFLALLRRTNLLSRYSSSSSVSSGWFGSIQPLCRGMRRCRGLVLGIIGRSASARCLAARSLAFRMSVLYFDINENNYAKGNGRLQQSYSAFPPAVRKMDTLNDLLAASDLVSLHCTLDEPIPILDAKRLQHLKPGAFIVNTSNSQLIDDCALKQLLIDGAIGGCALDGAEGPQWMEAWIREMPNVLILPRSADYSEEVWMEIREKAVSMLRAFFLNDVIPINDISDEDDEHINAAFEGEHEEKRVKDVKCHRLFDSEQKTNEGHLCPGSNQKGRVSQPIGSESSGLSQSAVSRSDGMHGRFGKKAKKRRARQSSHNQPLEFSGSSQPEEDDIAVSSMDQTAISVTTEDSKSKQFCESPSGKVETKSEGHHRKCTELMKDGFIVTLHAKEHSGLHVSRQRGPNGGWFLDRISNVTKRDPAAQFLVSFMNKDVIGLRSLAAGGRLLQLNGKKEFVFTKYDFDLGESWMLEGSSIEDCRLVNCRNPLAVLHVCIEIVAAVGEEDGIARWLD